MNAAPTTPALANDAQRKVEAALFAASRAQAAPREADPIRTMRPETHRLLAAPKKRQKKPAQKQALLAL